MAELWSQGFLVDMAIAITLLEWVGLALYRRMSGKGLPAQAYLLNLVSGLCLMLAVRSALFGQDWWWGATCLAASGVAHVIYLRQRWQQPS